MRDLVYLFEYILCCSILYLSSRSFWARLQNGDVQFSWVSVFSFYQLFQVFTLFSLPWNSTFAFWFQWDTSCCCGTVGDDEVFIGCFRCIIFSFLLK